MHVGLSLACSHNQHAQTSDSSRGDNAVPDARSLTPHGPYIRVETGYFGWACGIRADGVVKCAGESVTAANEAWMSGASAIVGFWNLYRCRIVNGVGSCIGTWDAQSPPMPASLGNIMAIDSNGDLVCYISGPGEPWAAPCGASLLLQVAL